ncbi:uncharacterized protein LOC118439440 [Folsomia candida]|nr:uncharacterized protein LOC118439440 [Folsomia candida]
MYSDTNRPLWGSDIKKSRTSRTNKIPSRLDYSFMLNYETTLRENSSLLELACFPKRSKVSIKAGAARIRFVKKISAADIYKILDHFSKIMNDEPTYEHNVTGIKKEEAKYPNIHRGIASVIPNEHISEGETVYQYLDKQLIAAYENIRVNPSLNNDLQDLEFYDKCIDDYVSGSEYRLIREDIKTDADRIVHKWKYPPTWLDVHECIIKFANELPINNTVHPISFATAMKKLRFWYKKPCDSDFTKRTILSLFQGGFVTELNSTTKIRWRISNIWCEIFDDALLTIEKEFVEKIKRYLILPGKPGYLPFHYKRDKNAKSKMPRASGDSAPRNKKSKTVDDDNESKAREKSLYEEIYNYSYLHSPGYFVGDQVEDYNIEFFDILYTSEKSAFLYHVKEKFGQNTRNAASQLRISLSLVLNNIISGFPGFQNYARLAEINGDNFSKRFRSEDDLRKCLNSASFVYAFADSNNSSDCINFADERSRSFQMRFDTLRKGINEKVENALKRNYDTEIDRSIKLFQERLISRGYLLRCGSITAKLLYETETNFVKEFVGKNPNTSKILWTGILKPFTKNYNSLLAKIELIELANYITTRNRKFKICQIPFDHTNQSSQVVPTDGSVHCDENDAMDIQDADTEVVEETDEYESMDIGTEWPSQRYGISNPGNTCYRNAATQLLLEIPEFVAMFSSNNADSQLKSWIGDRINETRSSNSSNIRPSSLTQSQCTLSQILGTPNMFVEGEQDDSSAFLLEIIDKLGDTFKRLFEFGVVRTNQNFQLEGVLNIPYPDKKLTMKKLFNKYLKGFGNRAESMRISLPSNYLILTLSIFNNNLVKFVCNKITNFADNISFVSNGKKYIYEVVGLICHIGETIKGGHYVCLIRRDNKKWIEYDDNNAPRERNVIPSGKDPYVILYRKLVDE